MTRISFPSQDQNERNIPTNKQAQDITSLVTFPEFSRKALYEQASETRHILGGYVNRVKGRAKE